MDQHLSQLIFIMFQKTLIVISNKYYMLLFKR